MELISDTRVCLRKSDIFCCCILAKQQVFTYCIYHTSATPKYYVFFAKTLNSCLVLHFILFLNECKNFCHNMTIRQALSQKKARKLVLRNVPDLIHSVVCIVGHKSIHVRTMSVQTSTPLSDAFLQIKVTCVVATSRRCI